MEAERGSEPKTSSGATVKSFITRHGSTGSDDDEASQMTRVQARQSRLPAGFLFVPFSSRLGREGYVSILLNLITIIFLVVCIPVNIPITTFNVVLSNTGRNIYTAGTTVLGGAIAAFIAGNVKELWFHDILWSRPSRRHLVPAKLQIRAADNNREARSMVALGTYADKALFWPQTTSLLITGLIATCIVTGLSPNISIKTETAPEWALAYSNDSCSMAAASASQADHGALLYNWTQPDGSWIGSTVGPNPSSSCASLLASLQAWYAAMEPDTGIAYETAGMAVRPGAIGMPTFRNISGPPQQLPFFSNMWSHQTSLPQISPALGFGQATGSEACLPVLARNPVSCTGIRNNFIDTGNGVFVAVGSNACNATFTGQKSRAGAVCTAHHALGKASLVIGERYTGTGSYTWSPNGNGMEAESVLLANVGTTYPSQLLTSPATFNYTISCDIDVASAIDFRNVRLDYLGQINGESPLQQLNISQIPQLAPANSLGGALTQYVLSGSQHACQPFYANGTAARLEDYVFPELLAEVTSVPWGLLNEYIESKQGLETQLEFLMEPYLPGSETQTIQGLYNESKSVLEDILGAAHGIALGIYAMEADASCYSADLNSCLADNDLDLSNLTAVVVLPAAQMQATYMTVGSGNWWGMIFIVPQLYAISLLIWLLRRRNNYIKGLDEDPDKAQEIKRDLNDSKD